MWVSEARRSPSGANPRGAARRGRRAWADLLGDRSPPALIICSSFSRCMTSFSTVCRGTTDVVAFANSNLPYKHIARFSTHLERMNRCSSIARRTDVRFAINKGCSRAIEGKLINSARSSGAFVRTFAFSSGFQMSVC